MVIQEGGISDRVVRLSMRGIHLTYKVANKCLNVRERVKAVERNKHGPLTPPGVP